MIERRRINTNPIKTTASNVVSINTESTNRVKPRNKHHVSTSFKPGQSGNPFGRPKAVKEIADLARSHAPDAIERLVYWMNSDEPKASIAAAMAILNRGCGMPMQAHELAGPNGSQLQAPSLAVHFVAAIAPTTKQLEQQTIDAE